MKCAAAYLRVAHIYMLISMPTETSTIFGAFQAIGASLLLPDELRPSKLRYCGSKSSPVKSFAWNPICLCCAAKGFHGVVWRAPSKRGGNKPFGVVRTAGDGNFWW